MIRYTIIASVVFAACFLGLGAEAQKAPFTIASPTDGATVREMVNITVSRGDLPRGGYAALWIDGYGVVASAVDDDAKTITFRWDTKEALVAPELPTKKLAVSDGEHTIKVVGYTGQGARFDESIVKVKVQNKIQRNLGEGVVLKLAFRLDQESRYEQESTGRFTDADGSQKWPLLQLQPLTVKRSWAQSVADIVSSDSAVLWRKFDKDGIAVGFGLKKPLTENNRISYIYQEKNNWTKPTARSRAIGEVGFDAWISYHDARVLPGDKWRPKVRILLDQVQNRAIENVKAVSVFEGLEWESGIECAKVVTQITWETGGQTMRFPTTDAYEMSVDKITGTITSYASLKTSRLVKVVEDLQFVGQFAGMLAQATTGTESGGAFGSGGPTGFLGPTGEAPPNPTGAADPNYMSRLGGASGGGPSSSRPPMRGGNPSMNPSGSIRPSAGGLQGAGQSGVAGSRATAERTKATLARKTVTHLVIR